MPPLVGTFMAGSNTSPLHLHKALAGLVLTWRLAILMVVPFSLAMGLPSLTVTSSTSLSVRVLPLTVVVATRPSLTVMSSSFQSPVLKPLGLYGPTVG